ncbi:MAG TPA: peptide chain release factor N(5)-glutamine methyltransferase [Vicinamibacterales bacterium]|nr:peptide chain release factor N(5)-glutamine methyltransferase [Vicinamibacterales bacterium]
MSIHRRVTAARERLRQAGISGAESDLDARLLAQHVLGWTTERFLTEAQSGEPDGFAPHYELLVARRATREPLAYIVGTREFWGLDFEVSPAVLIPRPSTELIVEAVLTAFPDRTAPLRIADLCTGCGCVAVAIAAERPSASIVATDISLEALEVAQRNASRHGVADRLTLLHTDLLDGVDGVCDAIVANPPYVLDDAGPALQPEVRDHEPALALFGGADGLGLVTRIVDAAPSRLRSGGFLIFEFGLGQDVEIEDLIHAAPDLQLADVRRDLQGIARTAVARRIS